MASYAKIQAWVKTTHGYVPKTCWIADVKAQHGLTTRLAANRASLEYRVHPCPPAKRVSIEAAVRYFGMIG
jgi:hypothetical protein